MSWIENADFSNYVPSVVVFILCQGEQKRLAELGYPKQLVKVLGQPLLERTIEQIKNYPPMRNAHIEVIGRVGLLDAIDPRLGVAGRELAAPGLCVVDGIRDTLRPVLTQNWVPTRWIILLGDVVWTDDAIERLLHDTRELVFAGTSDVSRSTGEVFGMAFRDPAAVAKLADTCPCRVGRDGVKLSLGKQQRGGHLRRLLWWAMEQQRLKPDRTQDTWSSKLYLPIDDATDDLDTPRDVENIKSLERELVAVRVPAAPKPPLSASGT